METPKLARNDLLQTAATRKRTLVVFPSGANKQQKIGAGDLSGVVQCFSIKKGECHTSFKSLPSSHRITALALGKGKSQRDKLFFAEDAVIRGLTKKGKEFFRFDTNMTESISSVIVMDNKLTVLGEYTVLSFADHKTTGVYLSPDRINDAEGLLLDGELVIALACQDRTIRLVNKSNVLYQSPVEGIPTSLVLSSDPHDPLGKFPGARELLFGTESGHLGQLFIDSDGLHPNLLLNNTDNRGSVVALFAGIDFNKDGMTDVVVGRDDGHLETYAIDEAGLFCEIFKTRLSERINTITGGLITSPTQQDLLVQTYTGKIIAYCPQGSGLFEISRTSNTSMGKELMISDAEYNEVLQKKILDLHSQVKTVSTQVEQKREASRAMMKAYNLYNGMNIKHYCRYLSSDNSFELSLETDRPLFCVAISSDFQIELLEGKSSVAILSQSAFKPEMDYPVLATYRCQESTNKLDILFRCKDGIAGCLTCFLVSKAIPRTAFVIRHNVLPLCLHQRIGTAPGNTGSMHELRIKGECTPEEFCLLFSAALPDFPKQWSNNVNSCLYYERRIPADFLEIEIKDQDVVARGKDICTLDILKKVIEHEANIRHRNLQLYLKLDTSCAEDCLRFLWKDYNEFRTWDEKQMLSQALHELEEQEENLEFLNEEMKSLFKDCCTLDEHSKGRSYNDESLYESLRSFILCCRKVLGFNTTSALETSLQSLLNERESNFEDLLKLLCNP